MSDFKPVSARVAEYENKLLPPSTNKISIKSNQWKRLSKSTGDVSALLHGVSVDSSKLKASLDRIAAEEKALIVKPEIPSFDLPRHNRSCTQVQEIDSDPKPRARALTDRPTSPRSSNKGSPNVFKRFIPSVKRREGNKSPQSPRNDKSDQNKNLVIGFVDKPQALFPYAMAEKKKLPSRYDEKMGAKLTQDSLECKQSLQSLGALVEIAQDISSSPEETFRISNEISRLNKELQALMKKEIESFYQTIFLTKDLTDKKLSVPQIFEEQVDDFKFQIISFILRAEKLKEALEKNEVSLAQREGDRVNKKKLVKMLDEFLQPLHPMQPFRNTIFGINEVLHGDEKGGKKIYEEVSKFINSLIGLQESFIRFCKKRELVVYPTSEGKEAQYKISIDEENPRCSPIFADHYLSQISKGVMQYSLQLKELREKASNMEKLIKERSLPFPTSANTELFEKLVKLTKMAEKGIDDHDSLYV